MVDLIGIEPMTSSMPFKLQIIDGTALMSWQSRQNLHNRRYLRQECDKLYNSGPWADRVGSACSSIPARSSTLANEADLDEKRDARKRWSSVTRVTPPARGAA
jgi:hypothetical protein